MSNKSQETLRSYQEHLEFKNYASIEYYASARDFIEWLSAQGIESVQSVGKKEIYDYFMFLKTRKKKRGFGILSDASLHKHLNGLRNYFGFLVESRRIVESPHIPRHKIRDRKETSSLTIDEIQELYDSCKTSKEKALLGIAYGCGLRRTEMVDLTLSDVNLYHKTVTVVNGKNSKRRVVHLLDSVVENLNLYLNERNELVDFNKPTRAFFVGDHGQGVKGETILRWFKAILLRTKITKNVTLHSLRHSLAEHLSDSGMNMEDVRLILGHSLSDTTQIYAKKNRMRSNQSLKIMQIK